MILEASGLHQEKEKENHFNHYWMNYSFEISEDFKKTQNSVCCSRYKDSSFVGMTNR